MKVNNNNNKNNNNNRFQGPLDAQHILLGVLYWKSISLLLLIAFTKDFDLDDHEILSLNKLSHYLTMELGKSLITGSGHTSPTHVKQ